MRTSSMFVLIAYLDVIGCHRSTWIGRTSTMESGFTDTEIKMEGTQLCTFHIHIDCYIIYVIYIIYESDYNVSSSLSKHIAACDSQGKQFPGAPT